MQRIRRRGKRCLYFVLFCVSKQFHSVIFLTPNACRLQASKAYKAAGKEYSKAMGADKTGEETPAAETAVVEAPAAVCPSPFPSLVDIQLRCFAFAAYPDAPLSLASPTLAGEAPGGSEREGDCGPEPL